MPTTEISSLPLVLPNSPRRNLPSGEIAEVLNKNRSSFIAVAIFSGVINLLYLTPAIYMLQIYDRVLNGQSLPTLVALTFLVFGLFIVIGMLEHYRSKIMAEIGNQVDTDLSVRVFQAAFAKQCKTPESQPGQALWDLNQVRQFFSGPGLFAVMDAPWMPLFIIVIFLLHPVLGWLSLFGAALLSILTIAAERLARQQTSSSQRLSVASNGLASTQLKNTDVISAMGMLPTLTKRWNAMHNHAVEQQYDAIERVGLISGSTRVLRLMLQSGVLGLGAYLVISGELSAGSMIAATILTTRALSPLESMLAHWKSFLLTHESVKRLMSLLEEFPKPMVGQTMPKIEGKISAENVYVAPPNRKSPILKGLNFQMGPSEIIGIIGPSAAGKSTLGRALLGIWPASLGTIRLNGSDITRWDRALIGPAMGYLPQDIELFNGTVAQNICRFGEVDSDQCIEAAMAVGIHNTILKFSEGYETQIGEAGVNLSGGQQQLIGLARAIYGNPVLVVLDEPDASLDEVGERALIGVVQKLKASGSTVILITHQPKLLQVVDRVMLIQDGQIHHVNMKKKEPA